MRPPVIKLLCLPCAGGSATMYARWRRLLPPCIDVVPVELPGRGGRMGEPFVEQFDVLVARLCEAHARDMSGAFALFGHSMGALLAYGMARHAMAAGRTMPRALFVSASAAPAKRDLAHMPADGDDAQLVADLRRQGGTPDEILGNADFLRMTLDALNADYRVCRSFVHRPSRPLPLPIHAFGGRDDRIGDEQFTAWRDEGDGAWSMRWFAGGHFYLREHEAALLAALVSDLQTYCQGMARPVEQTA